MAPLKDGVVHWQLVKQCFARQAFSWISDNVVLSTIPEPVSELGRFGGKQFRTDLTKTHA